MNKHLSYLVNLITSFFPSQLPQGRATFETWTDSIIALLGPGFEEVPLDHKRMVLATMIISLDAKRSTVPRRQFVKAMRKAAANQVAGQIFQEVQQAERQAKAEEQARLAQTKTVEATTQPLVVASGQG